MDSYTAITWDVNLLLNKMWDWQRSERNKKENGCEDRPLFQNSTGVTKQKRDLGKIGDAQFNLPFQQQALEGTYEAYFPSKWIGMSHFSFKIIATEGTLDFTTRTLPDTQGPLSSST